MNANTPKAWFEQLSKRSAALDWKVLLACIGISALIWLLSSLSTEGEFTLHYRFQPSELPEYCELRSEDEIPFEIQIKAKGISVFSKWIEREEKVIPLLLNSFPCSGEAISIPSRRLISLITPHLSEGQSVVRISPDTIFVPITKKLSNKLPLRANVQTLLPPGLILEGIVMKPDSIAVEGDERLIRALKAIETVPFELKDTLIQTVEIDLPKGISSTLEQVRIQAKTAQIEKRSIELQPEFDRPIGKGKLLVDGICTVSFYGTRANLKRINTSKIRAVIAPTGESNLGKIRLYGLEELPENVEYLIHPSEMAYLITE